jgi:hypothetical protein
MTVLTMRDASDPHHEPAVPCRKETGRSRNWGWIALGGCLGVLLALSPLILMVLGMALGSLHEQSEYAATRAAARAVTRPSPTPEPLPCFAVPPEVVGAIETRLTTPGSRLQEAHAVRRSSDATRWIVAARVEGGVRSEGDDDIGVWIVSWERAMPGSPPPSIPPSIT